MHYNIRWVIFISCEEIETTFFSNELRNENIAFWWKLKEKNNDIIIIGYLMDYITVGELCNITAPYTIYNTPTQIIEILTQINWKNQDFTKQKLEYISCYQQILGTFFDAIGGGWVLNLPESWKCIDFKTQNHISCSDNFVKIAKEWWKENPEEDSFSIKLFENFWNKRFKKDGL